MKLMPLAKIEKFSREHTLSMILIILDRMPKKRLAKLLYSLNKMQLPRIKRKFGTALYEQKVIGKAFIESESIKRKTKQKALPKRKTKRKFSRKQLAAQQLFAKRARAGTLRKRRKR